MNEIDILTFGVITDIIGKNCFTVSGVSTTQELKSKLEIEYPELKKINYAIAVNKQMVNKSTLLQGNTTVALLPPFSGG